MNVQRLRLLAIALICSMILVVIGWQLAGNTAPDRLLIAAALTLPLWAPIPGFVRGTRRTYAWATLCVIPYFVLGVTEAIANPDRRVWAALCIALALALFVTLILYLRASRGLSDPSLP